MVDSPRPTQSPTQMPPASSQNAATNNASPEARTAALLAQLMRYTRYVLAGDSQREVAWRMVSQLSAVLSVDRVLLVTASGKIMATNAGVTPAKDRPLAQTVRQLAKQQRGQANAQVLTGDDDLRSVEQQAAMGGSSLCWLPLTPDLVVDGATDDVSTQSGADYVLWVERWQGKQWAQQELDLLARLAPYLHAALNQRRRNKIRKKWPVIAAVAMLVVMLFPVREHAVATAYVVPDKPAIVTAPLKGVIAEVLAVPGASVVAGAPLLTYDRRVFDQQLVESQQAVAVAQAELQRLQAAGYGDLDARAQIKAQTLEVRRLDNQLTFLQQQLEFTTLKSPSNGVLQMQDAATLQGLSVNVGERLASIVQSGSTRLRLEVPVREVGLLKVGSEVRVRMNSSPLKTWAAKITHLGFAVVTSSEALPVVEAQACWVSNDHAENVLSCVDQTELGLSALSAGQQGNARIYAGWTVLGYQILRRPLSKLLALLGI